MAFEECYDTTTVSTEQKKINWIQIMVYVIITVVVIAVIVTLILVLRRRKDKPKKKRKTKTQSGISQSSKSSLSQRPKGSITENIDRYHNLFIDSKTETSTVKEDKASPKASVNKSHNKAERRVSPPKKTSVKSPKRTFAKTKLI